MSPAGQSGAKHFLLDTQILLDTHTFLWMASDPGRLSDRAREVIDASSNDLLLSVASVWEMAIQSSLGSLDFEKIPILGRDAVFDDYRIRRIW